MTLERGHIPDRAVRERQRDMEWIGENLLIFGPVAAAAFDEEGRGAIVVDITSRPTGQGHPFGYVLQAEVEELDDEDIRRMVREYDPDHEFVVVMLGMGILGMVKRPADRKNGYRNRYHTQPERSGRDSRPSAIRPTGVRPSRGRNSFPDRRRRGR